MLARHVATVLLVVGIAAAGCSGSSGGSDAGEAENDTGAVSDATPADATPADAAAPDAGVDETADPVPDLPAAEEIVPDVPAGPAPAEPLKYSEGHCPTFVAGKNDFKSAGRNRTAYVYLPAEPKGAPVLFIFHGQGDTGKSIAEYFGGDAITKTYGAIVVSPSNCCAVSGTDCCDMMTVWGYAPFSDHEPDVTLFDDILSCLEEQFDVDNSRVYATGFSAGALWTTWLAMNRSDYLAAAAIFSGGVGQMCEYTQPTYKIPALLAWGGQTDTYTGFVKFYEMMNAFSQNLQEAGHLVVECDHGLGHTMPWGSTKWALEFLMAHTWYDGSSPFVHGLSSSFPKYCVIP
jgi:dienelactone hydrolase